MKELYGPYIRKSDGRSIVVYNGKTMLYAKYLLEKKLGRELLEGYTVDHKDGNPLNDSEDNLQELLFIDNVIKSIKPAEMFLFNCPVCGIVVEKALSKIRHNWKQGKAGPFCNKRCARYFQLGYTSVVEQQT